MGIERQIRLESDNEGQTIHIPSDFALPGNLALIRKEGDSVIIRPAESGTVEKKMSSLIAWLQQQEPIDEDFDFDEKGPYPREFKL